MFLGRNHRDRTVTQRSVRTRSVVDFAVGQKVEGISMTDPPNCSPGVLLRTARERKDDLRTTRKRGVEKQTSRVFSDG